MALTRRKIIILSSSRRCTLRESTFLTLYNGHTTNSQICTRMLRNQRGAKSTGDAGWRAQSGCTRRCMRRSWFRCGARSIILARDMTYEPAEILTLSGGCGESSCVLARILPCCSYIYWFLSGPGYMRTPSSNQIEVLDQFSRSNI